MHVLRQGRRVQAALLVAGVAAAAAAAEPRAVEEAHGGLGDDFSRAEDGHVRRAEVVEGGLVALLDLLRLLVLLGEPLLLPWPPFAP